jgi:uncharacterized protein
MQTLESIHLIAQRLASVAGSPSKVILFGSYARGEANEESDVDLLVLQNDFSDRAQEYLKLAREAHLMDPKVEVILMKNEDYAWKSLVGGTLPYWASKEGLVLHDPA